MTTQAEETPSTPSLERRVRRLEDAHASMEKSISGLGTQLALAEQEQRHTRELMDTRFTGLESALAAVSAKVDTLTNLFQTQSTDPQGSLVNREVERRLAAVEAKVSTHDGILQQGVGASRVVKAGIAALSAAGVLFAAVNTLHILGVIK